MKTTNLTTLKINKISQAQYKAALDAGMINENEFYIIPDANENVNNIKIITIPRGRMRGDINGDGSFEGEAFTLTIMNCEYYNQATIEGNEDMEACDLNADGSINVNDAQALANSGFKPGKYAEITGNWTNNPNYATEDAQFYTDIPITGMTANHSALITVKGSFENGFFTKAECIEGAIRIYAKLCPISTCQAIVTWGDGNGTAVIITENEDLTIYNEHINNTDIHVTADEKAAWNESDVFVAQYNTTTNAEIEAAYQAGKTILLDADADDSNVICGYFAARNSNGTFHRFYSLTDGNYFAVYACKNNTWGYKLLPVLPNVSSSDSGKVLMVNNSGSWTATVPEKSIFIATYETTTFDELVNAYNSGKIIVVKYNGTIYQLVSADTATSFVFMAVTKNDEYINYIECELTNDWTVFAGKRFLPTAGIVNSQKILKVNSSGIPEWSDATVDSALSGSSTNPVQNKVINTALNTKVDLSSTQSIAGEKTFSDNLTANANLNVGGNIVATGTITGSKVYNATWNDYAEWFEKNNIEEIFEPGDICVWFNNGVIKSSKACDKAVIGIVSNTYGHILGGKELENMEDNNKEFVPIGLAGRVKCKVIGKVEVGDLIVTSNIPGTGIVNNDACLNQVIGKALENSNEDDLKQITILLI